MLPATVNLTAYRGDTWAQTFRLFDEVGTPHDLTDSELASWVKRNGKVEHLQVFSDAPTEGEVTIAHPVTGPLVAGHYTYDVEVIEDSDVTTWVRGQLEVEPDVTNAP